ncbi:putative brct domain containing protein [Daldinia childiae]|uniref:putative brct domain containing protein n=1 Tax=Daldinia childiae TaxID=326645 RepID=UPI00144754A1|nr:putative brct domain containing protein [Daldinia childiae]KAF3059282.1 putative brct domain containing protein [Daldinia childiae]
MSRRHEKGISSTLDGCDISIAAPLGDDWDYVNVARWTTWNGGIFCNVVDKDVTHVLATPEQYEAKISTIQQAIKFKAHIVTKDWFEDSLRKRRHLNEEDYSLENIDKEDKAKKEREAKAQKGIKEAESFVNTNLHHIYRDDTYFAYEITLTRNDKESGNIGQKYQLYLWESNAKPHLYMFAAKFYKKPRDSRPSIYRPRETGVCLEMALRDFVVFFYQKTGIHWNNRIVKAGTTDKSKFQYKPPTGGKPVGTLYNLAPESLSVVGNGTNSASAADSTSSTKKDQKQALPDKAVSRKRKSSEEPVQRTGGEKRQRREKEKAKVKEDDKKKVEKEKVKEKKEEEKPNYENSVSSRTRGKTAANNKKRARACEDDDDLAVERHETAKRQKVKGAGPNEASQGEQPEISNLSAVVRAMKKTRSRKA